MNTVKFIIVCITFGLLAGCVIREDRGGPEYDHDRDGYRHQERGPERGGERDYDHGHERDRGDEQRRFN